MSQEEYEIKVWAQMFFDDGSVSRSERIPASILDDELGSIRQLAVNLLQETHRTEGFLVIWGAGTIFNRYYVLEGAISSSSGL
jgi:hypothetical protein